MPGEARHVLYVLSEFNVFCGNYSWRNCSQSPYKTCRILARRAHKDASVLPTRETYEAMSPLSGGEAEAEAEAETGANKNTFKRGLGYGVRAPVFYGNLREQTGEKRFSINAYRKLVLFLQKSPKTSGSLWIM